MDPSAPLADHAPRSGHGVDLSIVVPTFNERGNIVELVARLSSVLDGVAWEIIVVDDDSPDGTAELVATLARRDPRVRGIRRIGRRGLSSACIEGMLSSSAPYVAVMDADLQHDETLLPAMLASLRDGGIDIAVASRYMAGGSTDAWSRDRAAMSRTATRIGRLAVGVELSDPMSGFFMLTREAFHAVAPDLSGIGFKILLDVFASASQPLRFREFPFRFRPRHAGESKLDERVLWDFGMLLLDKKVGHILPARFVAFVLVGGLGVFVHFAFLAALHRGLGMDFSLAQAAATLVAMTSNFALNNVLTYRDRRLEGFGLVRGWLSFVAVCGLGALANVGVASYLFEVDTVWWLSALAGALVGSVWNFAVTARYAWSKT